MSQLKVLTLNCWGVPTPIACQLRLERMTAIGDRLKRGDYDLVVLQEVWDKADFKILLDRVSGVFVYNHYFYSGAIGSGVCVFSKFPILESFYYRFSLNGYAHKVFHGDWFGGKGVGMCIVKFQDFRLGLFCTHLHAEYSEADDEYLAHRVSQAFEMSQLIKLTATKHLCDFVVTAGDFNLQPTDLGYKLLRENAKLRDAWLELNDETDSGKTCDIPSNYFTTPAQLKVCPNGKRLDYILFRNNEGTSVEVVNCQVTMGKIPGHPYNYSDHEGVGATLNISKGNNAPHDNGDPTRLEPLLSEAKSLIERGIGKVSSNSQFYTILAIISVCLLYMLSSLDIPPWLGLFRGMLLVALTLLFGFCIWNKAILSRIETHGLMATKNDIRNLLNSQKS
ncbi:putative neutral sphingomyelinase [Ylistrum balloti]|uniref:putative neutral sphingomyelinase n=1 Tax=Ylistrum balloti TaxID=509963 RepID=UPI002905DAB2|nr:putative neutral sphingomyelinase [Ylistrum balloti]